MFLKPCLHYGSIFGSNFGHNTQYALMSELNEVRPDSKVPVPAPRALSLLPLKWYCSLVVDLNRL